MCITIRISLLCDTTFNNKEPQSTVSNLTVSRSEHITPAGPALTSLHWLCVPDLISFKLAVMRYWSIHGTSLSYIQSCCTRVSNMTSNRRQRSSTSHRLDAPPVCLSTVSKRAFPVSGATVWNDLPLHVTSVPSLAVYRQQLKTFLFSCSYEDTIIWLVCYYYHSSLLSGHLRSLQ